MPASLLVTGARVFLYLNGRKIGRATAFGWRSITPRKAIYGLDSSEPYELAPTTTKMQGTVSLLRSAGDGGVEGMGIAGQYEDLSREKYATILLLERKTGLVLFRADECSVTDQQWNVAAKAKLEGGFSFEGLTWNNETIKSHS